MRELKYQSVVGDLDLNDPEEGFTFSSRGQEVELSFVDWRRKRVRISFRCVFKFCFSISDQFGGLPEAKFLEFLDSADVRELVNNSIATPGDALRHFVISSNENQWVEVIASAYEFRTDM